MRWDDVIVLAQDSASEPVTSGSFMKDYQLKLAASMAQVEATTEIPCLEQNGVAIPVATGTTWYNLPADFAQMRWVASSGGTILDREFDHTPDPNYPTVTQGTPVKYSIRGNKIGLTPAPTSTGNYFLWYFRKSIPYAFSMKVTTTSGVSAIFTTTQTSGYLTISSGSSAGTSGITLSTYATVGSGVAGLQAALSHLSGINIWQCSGCPSGTHWSGIETAMQVQVYNQSRAVFMSPELPEEMVRPILVNAIEEQMAKKDKDFVTAKLLRTERSGNIANIRGRQRTSSLDNRFAGLNENPRNSMGRATKLGLGGYVINS